MNWKQTSLIIVLFILCASFQNKKLIPFTFLKAEKSLIVKKDHFPNLYVDTLSVEKIKDLSTIEFESKNFKVEKIGNTPDYSINLFEKKNRICLISVWKIDNGKLAININNLSTDKFYYGFVINQSKFESIFKFKKAK